MPLNTIHGGVLERQAYRTGTRGSRGPSDREEGKTRILRRCRCREFMTSIAILQRRGKWSEREIGGDYRKICEGLRKRGDERDGSISIIFQFCTKSEEGEKDGHTLPRGMRMLRLLHCPILLLCLWRHPYVYSSGDGNANSYGSH